MTQLNAEEHGKRARFDPAKFVLGLVLLPIAALLTLRALGKLELSYLVLVLLVPAALLLSGLVAAGDRLLRRRRRARVRSSS